MFEISSLEFVKMQYLFQIKEIQISDQNWFCRQEFDNHIVIFDFSTLEHVQMQGFLEKKKLQIGGQK